VRRRDMSLTTSSLEQEVVPRRVTMKAKRGRRGQGAAAVVKGARKIAAKKFKDVPLPDNWTEELPRGCTQEDAKREMELAVLFLEILSSCEAGDFDTESRIQGVPAISLAVALIVETARQAFTDTEGFWKGYPLDNDEGEVGL